MKKGIDVSKWQGTIDWDSVKKSGIDFAILRCGFGSDVTYQDDKNFIRNAKECARVGLPYGVYLYSYADTVEKAKSEAAHVLRLLKNLKPEYPIYYDLEDKITAQCGKNRILEISKTFVEILEKAGYWVGIYANLNWNKTYLTDKWYDTKARWVAQYNDKCDYQGAYGMWQFTSSGKVNGIKGDVDMNYAYVDYPKLIKEAGKNGFIKSANSKPSAPKKTIDEIAKEVINGKWGNGEDRKNRLKKAGYDYDAVQKKVNSLVSTKKSIDEVAEEVIQGKWGNGEDRKQRLTKAGYNYSDIQKKVNELI